ncbi:uncharacterized protein LOC141588689 [Silene latifolia]|uniref:uncharacterized protein LOC141588689 n=1 Tax=Silene latifolia TaxID=37657 RepID=UPI003D777AF0
MAAVPMRDNLAPKKVVNPSIVKPPIQANNFDVKATLLQLVQGNQFGGGATENPNEHLNEFLDSCDMFKVNGVSKDTIRLRLFPYFLRGSAKEWLKSCEPDSFRTWNDVSKAFLNKYFPPQRIARIKSELKGFTQHDDEALYEAWESQFQASNGKFPDKTEENPKTINAIHLRSGRELEDRVFVKRKNSRKPEVVVEPPKVVEDDLVEVVVKTPMVVDEPTKIVEEPKEQVVRTYVPPIPFPQRLARAKLGQKYGKFMHMMKGVNITMPFIDVIKEIPAYGKFLKELISNKNSLSPSTTVNLSKECSAILMNELPQNLEDPGSFSIPCTIGSIQIKRALCDLGASISLLPLKIFKKLKGFQLLPTRVSLQLADRSVRYPIGLVEDVPLKVGKLVIPCDFYVMDIPEDSKITIILGRPCLATGGAMIDVKNGKLFLQVGDDKMEFSLEKSMKSPSKSDSCCRVDVLEDCLNEHNLEPSYLDPLEVCLNKEENGGDLVLRVDVKGDLGEDHSREDKFEDQINDEIESFFNSPDSFNLSSLEDAS